MSAAGYLSGEHVALRARHPEDVPILHAQLYEDVVTRSHADTRPWRPIPPDPALSPYAVAVRVGFAEEGVAREAAWTTAGFTDVVMLGLLAADWRD